MSLNHTYRSSPKTGQSLRIALDPGKDPAPVWRKASGAWLQARLGTAGGARCLAKRRLPSGIHAQCSLIAPITQFGGPSLVAHFAPGLGSRLPIRTPRQSVAPKVGRKQLAPAVAERFARRRRCLFFEENKLQHLLHQNLAVRIERALHAYALSFKLGHIALMIDVVHLS